MLKFIQWLFGSSRSQPLIQAQAARSAARQAYLDAWTRGDTRSMHAAELRLKAATLAELGASRQRAHSPIFGRLGQRETPPVGRRGLPTNGLNVLGEH